MEYVVYYDILLANSGVEGGSIATIIGIALAVFLLKRSLRTRRQLESIFLIAWLIGVISLAGLGHGNVYYQHYRCTQWMRTGNYQVVEGRVANFVPYRKPSKEHFSVNAVYFEYSPYDLTVCGFKQLAQDGSPIKDGLMVRVTYQEGRILKLEIAEIGK